MVQRFTLTLASGVILGASVLTAPTAQAQSMQLDPGLPLPAVSTAVSPDGNVTITLESPVPNDVCVWAAEWDTGDELEHGMAAGLRPGGKPPSQNQTVPPACGSGTLPTSLTITPAQVGPAATSIRIRWSPTSNIWTYSDFTTLTWPIAPDTPGEAPTLSLAWSPDGALRASATTASPCHWRFESRLASGAWSGTWVGGEPGQPCTGLASATWGAPESLWSSAGQARVAYTSSSSSTVLSEWATAEYSYVKYSAPKVMVAKQQVAIDGTPEFACRVAVSWRVGAQWTDASPVPAKGCGLPGVAGVAPIAFSDAPDGAKQLRLAYLSTPEMSSLGAWTKPIPLSGLLPAEDAVAVEQPDGSVDVSFVDPNPIGGVCAWRWELQRKGEKNVFGAGSKAVAPTTKVSCGGTVAIPAKLDDPANVNLVLWPDSDGTNDPADESPKVYVDLPDVDLSDSVKTGDAKGPLLSIGWWTSSQISTSVPRAKVSAPASASGTCSYRLQWTAAGVAPRGVWTSGPCSGVWVELPQLALGWAGNWKVQAAWAKETVGAKPAKYSSFTTRAWDSGALDAASLQVFNTSGGTPAWYLKDPPVAACNAQVQLLSTTDPATWQVLSDTYAVPLGKCDDLWAEHPISAGSAQAMRVRLTGSTTESPVGRWMYASLTPLSMPTDAVVRWNDAGAPVLVFTDPNPLGTVCFWQVRVESATVVDDVQIGSDGSTTCSTATTFPLDGKVDWSKVTWVDIRGTAIPQVTALDSWGLAGVASVPYEPRLTPAGGAAPSVQLQVDQWGYPEVHVTGSSCRYVAQWRVSGETLWRTEPLPSSSACSSVLRLNSAGTTSDVLEVRAASAKVSGAVVGVSAWSKPAATVDPLPTPQVALYPNSKRVRVQNQPSSVCGTFFEVRRNGMALTSGLVRASAASGQLDCGPWALETIMIGISAWYPETGDEVRFAFIRGVGPGVVVGPWGPWTSWPTSDVSDPTVSITAPVNGSVVTGDVNSVVTASDDLGVERVEIRSGTRLLGTALVPSNGDTWTIPWDSWALPDGPVTYTATAYDTSGNSAMIEGRVIIKNPPAVDATSAKGATVVKVSGKPNFKAAKPLTVQVPRGQPVVMRVKDPVYAGAKVSVRLGNSWVAFGKVDKKGWVPTLQINGPGPYLMRLQPKTGKPGYLGLSV